MNLHVPVLLISFPLHLSSDPDLCLTSKLVLDPFLSWFLRDRLCFSLELLHLLPPSNQGTKILLFSQVLG